MSNLSNSAYQTNRFSPEDRLLESVWVTDPMMGEEAYRKEVQLFFDDVARFRPKLILVNAVDSEYNVLPETQEWIVSAFYHIYIEIGTKKMAWVVSKDLFTQVSIEQTVEEGGDIGVQNRYFEERRDALSWLKE